MRLAELIQMWLKNKWGIDSNIDGQIGATGQTGIDPHGTVIVAIANTIRLCGRYNYIKLIVYHKNYGHGRVVVINNHKYRDGYARVPNDWFHHEDPSFFNKIEKCMGLKL